jgi:hypothetical protein
MLEVKPDSTGKGMKLISTTAVKKGEIFHRITDYKLSASSTYTSIQLNSNTHLEEYYVSYLNHSCSPSVILDTANLVLVAARDIQPGEELSIFYPSTEWHMAAPFACLCGASQCLKLVAGAKFLSLNRLSQHVISYYITNRISDLEGDNCLEMPAEQGVKSNMS